MSINEKNDAGIAFLHICTERHVPTKVWAQIAFDLPKNAGVTERNDYFLCAIEQIKRDWPFIPMEEYLAHIEESKDWDDLRRHGSVYWQDVPSMLADAVRTRSVQTVRQLALHCLFRNPQLKEEMLALAPDQRTQKALMYPPRVKEEEHYRQYPFCIAENGCVDIFGRHQLRKRYAKVISLPDDVQTTLFERFKKIKGFATTRQLYLAAHNESNGAEQRVYPTLEDRLYRMGYQIVQGDIVCVPMPECWLANHGLQDEEYTSDELVSMGIVRLQHEAYYLGYDFKFDGVNNSFGYTGYTYLTQWP